MTEQTEPLVLLALYRGVIAFDQWVEVENETEQGVAAKCQDGSDRYYIALCNPSFGDCLGVDTQQDASFESLRNATMEAGGWGDADQLPWCDLDDEDEIVPATDILERLVAWLQSPVGSDGGTDWEWSLLERWSAEATVYAAGMEIYSALSDVERRELSLAHADLGGPASSVPCVTSQAPLAQLNETMRARSLPFVFVAEYPDLPE